jgi:GAF domain-containing protein
VTEAIAQILDDSVGLETALLEIVDQAIAYPGADFGDIALLDPKTQDILRIVVQRGLPPWWVDFWNSAPAGHGVAAAVLKRGERIIVDDVERSPLFEGSPALDFQRRADVRAVQSTPIVTRTGRPLGVLSTYYKVPTSPDACALRLLDQLARHAADIVVRTRSEDASRRHEQRYRTLLDTAKCIGSA